jgi:3-carboxy-cis,cis-muconate cycloisomerase
MTDDVTPSSAGRHGLHDPLLGDTEVAESLSDRARLQAMLDFEAALAEAEAGLGVIPASSAGPIRAAAKAGHFDPAAIAAEAARAGNLAIPLVRHLTRRVADEDPEAARHVHWGATSQDVIDTGLVLQLREAVPIVRRHLEAAADAAAVHAARHVETVMAGRTWLQQATPVTFGLKAAGWLEALERGRERISVALDEATVLQFGGASGTLAALGSGGLAVAEALGARLGLAVPDAPWHAHRDRLAALAAALGIAVGTLGKVARDLSLLAQTEVGEAFEAPSEGRGGSSTMPHKRNPVASSVALAAATRAPGLVATLLFAMPQEHERGLGGWPAEWESLPELVLVAAGAARAVAGALEGLVVNPARMRANLDASQGLPLAESVTMALAVPVGKDEAHKLVEAAARRAVDEGRALADVLAEDPAVTRHLGASEIASRLAPENYLGAARGIVERVLARRKARGAGHA